MSKYLARKIDLMLYYSLSSILSSDLKRKQTTIIRWLSFHLQCITYINYSTKVVLSIKLFKSQKLKKKYNSITTLKYYLTTKQDVLWSIIYILYGAWLMWQIWNNLHSDTWIEVLSTKKVMCFETSF